MNIRKDLLVGALALTCATGAAQANSTHKSTSTQPQSTLSRQTTGQNTSSTSQLNLTPQQKQQIFNAAQSLPQQNAQSALSPGSKVPSNLTLSPLPQQAKQNLGSTLQNSQIAKLQNGEVIVVNPSNKTVQAVITAQDANSTTGEGSANRMSTSPSTSQGSGMRK
jgi:Spy/CpxP family protein refolding chaperone